MYRSQLSDKVSCQFKKVLKFQPKKDEWIKALEQQLQATQNRKVSSTANQEASEIVDQNDLAEIH